MSYSAEQIESIGGKRWTHPSTGQVRLYLNNWPELIGVDVSYYRSGNISGATLDGKQISNRAAGQLLAAKVYWQDGKLRSNLADIATTARTERFGVTPAELVNRLSSSVAKRVADEEAKAV